jgi:ribonuclease P protein component
MLPRAKRLTRADFAQVAKGKRALSAHFSVTVLSSPIGRAAAVVSKKVAKRSVDRHQLKRRILAVAASHIQNGRSFVVFARGGSPALSSQALRQELTTLLRDLPRV